MTAGLFIFAGDGFGRLRRPKSKKEVKEVAAADPSRIVVENTSLYGGFEGGANGLEVGESITFVGPDPYTDRAFFGTITRTAKGIKVT